MLTFRVNEDANAAAHTWAVTASSNRNAYYTRQKRDKLQWLSILADLLPSLSYTTST